MMCLHVTCSYGYDPFGLSKKPDDFEKYVQCDSSFSFLNMSIFLMEIILFITDIRHLSWFTPGGPCLEQLASSSLKLSTNLEPTVGQKLSGSRYATLYWFFQWQLLIFLVSELILIENYHDIRQEYKWFLFTCCRQELYFLMATHWTTLARTSPSTSSLLSLLRLSLLAVLNISESLMAWYCAWTLFCLPSQSKNSSFHAPALLQY